MSYDLGTRLHAHEPEQEQRRRTAPPRCSECGRFVAVRDAKEAVYMTESGEEAEVRGVICSRCAGGRPKDRRSR